jgi:transposase
VAAERLSMRKVREILRLKWELGFGQREIAQSLSLGKSTVGDCLRRAASAGLVWPLDAALDDVLLEAKLYHTSSSQRTRVMPDLRYVHEELRRKGVTLQLLWQEYKEDHPDDGYQYSQFCELHRTYTGKLDLVLRQEHRAGEKMFVDFSGDGFALIDASTGEIIRAELFVAVLGASSYTYFEVTPSQDLHCWIQAHIHAYEFFAGVTEITVPDQTRTAITHPCRYEPDLHRTYEDMARHYHTVVIPARPGHPKDKAKVEEGVLLAQRWINAVLRNHKFFNVAEANVAVREKGEILNNRKFRKVDATRRQLYEKLDRPALRPLPPTRYEFAEWSRPRAGPDYHVEVGKHLYSVPFQLVHQKLDARLTSTVVEIFRKGQRVASHVRIFDRRFSTQHEHMPKAHQEYVAWTPERIIDWAGKTGPNTAQLVEEILESRLHPQQGFRSCLGILRLGPTFGGQRLEAACARALDAGTCSFKSVNSILKTGLDRQPVVDGYERSAPIDHENIRGPQDYE